MQVVSRVTFLYQLLNTTALTHMIGIAQFAILIVLQIHADFGLFSADGFGSITGDFLPSLDLLLHLRDHG